MNDEQIQALAIRLQEIEIAEPVLIDGSNGIAALAAAERQIAGSILARFSQFLADNAASLPSKAAVLDMLSKAIDLAFSALNRPLIASLLKPLVKQAILQAAGNLYDSILNTTPTIEV